LTLQECSGLTEPRQIKKKEATFIKHRFFPVHSQASSSDTGVTATEDEYSDSEETTAAAVSRAILIVDSWKSSMSLGTISKLDTIDTTYNII
jgi:hypothetical protein